MGTFFKSFWSRMGRNTGNRVSNAIFGDKWSTPYRASVRQDSDEKGTGKSKTSKKKSTSSTRINNTYDSDISADTSIFASYANMENAYTFAKDYINTRNRKQKELYAALRQIIKMPIPKNEAKIVEMLHALASYFSSLSALKSVGYIDDEESVISSFRNAIYRKYSQALSSLEYLYPSCPFAWSLFVGKWRMFFSRRPWSWIWVAYVIVLFMGTISVINHPIINDIILLSALWAIPLLTTVIILFSRYLRMH